MRSHCLHMACAQFSPIEKFKYLGNQTILLFPTQYRFRQNNSVTDYILNVAALDHINEFSLSYFWFAMTMSFEWKETSTTMILKYSYHHHFPVTTFFSKLEIHRSVHESDFLYSLWAELPPCVMFRGVDFCRFHRKISLRFEGGLQVVE